MKAGQNIERIYELLEQFDFSELSAKDKNCVLSEMTEVEYYNMRETISDTQSLFEHTDEPKLETSPDGLNMKIKYKSPIIKLINRPMQLYKVAALIAVTFAISAVVRFPGKYEKDNVIAMYDTVYIHKTDTLFTKIVDTVRIITEKIVKVPEEKTVSVAEKTIPSHIKESDCSTEICPGDIEQIKRLAYSSDISKDTLLSDFIVAIR